MPRTPVFLPPNPPKGGLQTIRKPEHEQKSLRLIICPFIIPVISDIIKFGPEREYFGVTIFSTQIKIQMSRHGNYNSWIYHSRNRWNRSHIIPIDYFPSLTLNTKLHSSYDFISQVIF